MFDFVDKHKKAIMIALMLLIIPPFAMFGIETYFTGRDVGQAVARVGDYAITQDEFSRGLRDQQQALQRMTERRRGPRIVGTTHPGLGSRVVPVQLRQLPPRA